MLRDLSEEELKKKIEIQAYIDRVIDIKYECYYLGVTEVEFWRKVLWTDNTLKKSNQESQEINNSKYPS